MARRVSDKNRDPIDSNFPCLLCNGDNDNDDDNDLKEQKHGTGTMLGGGPVTRRDGPDQLVVAQSGLPKE